MSKKIILFLFAILVAYSLLGVGIAKEIIIPLLLVTIGMVLPGKKTLVLKVRN